MSDSSENSTLETEQEPPVLTPGEQLREAREKAGESLKDVAARTHQSIDTLKALEAMETGDLSPTVVRMQAARYARALGLPDKDIADGFAQQRSMMDVERIEHSPVSFGRLVGGTALPVLALTALFLIAGGALTLIGGERSASVKEIPVSKRLIEREMATSRMDQSIQDLDRVRVAELSIVALKPAWIEVRGSDGTIFRSRTMARGEVYYPRMDAGWTVTARNPNAFVWALDGEQIMPMGQADSPIYSLSVDTMAQQLVTLRREQLAEATQD